MFGDAWRSSREAAPNQPQSIRAKIRVWRAPMRREGVGRENFFIAKIRDSESVRAVFVHIFRCIATPIAHRSLMLRIEESAAAQAFLVIP
jgi:hypothetical protein